MWMKYCKFRTKTIEHRDTVQASLYILVFPATQPYSSEANPYT